MKTRAAPVLTHGRTARPMGLATYVQAKQAMTIRDMVASGCAKQPAQILQWIHGYAGRAPSAEACACLERVSIEWAKRHDIAPIMTVEKLRPDYKWSRVPDDKWPHPDGRPVLEVAAAA